MSVELNGFNENLFVLGNLITKHQVPTKRHWLKDAHKLDTYLRERKVDFLMLNYKVNGYEDENEKFILQAFHLIVVFVENSQQKICHKMKSAWNG